MEAAARRIEPMLRPHHAWIRAAATKAAQLGGGLTGGFFFLLLSQPQTDWRWAWAAVAGLCLVVGAIVAIRYIPYGDDA